MARPLWKGTLGFGLVSIPVEIHSAVRDLGPHFHFLRRSDRSRVGFQKVAKTDGAVVQNDELVKGYEYEKGRYVVLTAEDFEKAAVKRTSRIDLIDFVSGSDVDDRYFDTPYYLMPGQGGEQAYTLLREALRRSGRIGIAKFVLHNRSHLAAVEVIDKALVLSTLRFRGELVPVSAYPFPDSAVGERELAIAQQLIAALDASWDPDKYTDEYRANLMRIIDAKRTHTTPELERQEPAAEGAVLDLMERLRRSLGQAAGSRGTVARRGSVPPPPARKARARARRRSRASRRRSHT